MKCILPTIFMICLFQCFSQQQINCEISTEWSYFENSICAGDSIGAFSFMNDAYYSDCLDGEYDTIVLNSSQSIQACLDTVSPGKVLLLEDGIYYENIVWPITNRIILSSLNGPENCIVDGINSNESVIYLGNGDSNSGMYDPLATFLCAGIQNIQIRNGYGSIPVFHNSIRMGGGILIDEYMKVVVSNCIIHNNGFGPETNGQTYSGGMFVSFGSEAYLFNNTITDNIGPGIWWRSRHDNFEEESFEFATWPYGVKGCAVNNILANNGGYGIYIQSGITRNSLQIRYNNSYGNGGLYPSMGNWYDSQGVSSYTETGFNGNISEDPLFTNSSASDYSLQLTSPSIGSGQYGLDMGYQGDFEILNSPITYSWSNGETSESITFTPYETQDLILTITQGESICIDTITIEVSGSYIIDTRNVCDSLTWIDGNTYYSNNQSAIWSSSNAGGCDSIIQLNLTVDTLNAGINILDDITLKAEPINANYQWVDCDNNYEILNSETSQTMTASYNSSFAVIVSQGGCVDTTGCLLVSTVSINDEDFNTILLYPNPTKNLISIESENSMNNKFAVYDQQGRLVIKGELNGVSTEVSLGKLSKGTYTINIEGNYEPAVIIKD